MRRLGTNIATTYVARFANIIAIFLLFAWVADSVGAEAYGVYLLTASLAALLSMDLGMAGATTRYIAVAVAESDDVQVQRVTAASTVFFLGVGVVAAAATVAIVAVGWSSFAIPEALRLAAVQTTALAAAQAFSASALSVNRHVLAGAGRLDAANFTQLGQIVIRVILTLAVLAVGGGIVAVAAVDLTVVIAAGLTSWVLRRKMLPASRSTIFNSSRATFRELLGLSIDFLIMSIASLLILQTGNLIVGLFLPIAAVTMFSAGFRVYQAARELTNSLTSAMLPYATALHTRREHDANQRLYLIGTRYANLVVLTACIPLIVFAPLVMELWLGPGFDEAAVVTQVLLGSLLVNTQHLVAVPILAAQGRIRGFSMLHGVWSISCLILGVLLTPVLGVVGMALAIAVPVVVLEPAYLWVLIRRIDLSFKQYLTAMGPLFASALVLAGGLAGFATLLSPTLWSTAATTIIWALSLSLVYWLLVASPGERRFVVVATRRVLGKGF